MEPVLSLCGFRCDLCLAYQPLIEAHPENRQILSDGWHTYFGFRLPPEEIHCGGCSAEGKDTLDRGCPVRPCVTARGLANCAHCQDYICEKLTERLIDYNEIQRAFDHPIPVEDRRRFLLPYENAERLKAIRSGSES